MRLKLGRRTDPVEVRRATDQGDRPGEAPPVPAKMDVDPEIAGIDPEAEPLRVSLRIPAYDLATANRLMAVSVAVKPQDAPDPETPEAWLGSGLPVGTLDTSEVLEGGLVVVEVPGVPDGLAVAQVILAFES